MDKTVEGLKGKTIMDFKFFDFDEQLIIMFTDDTYCSVQIDSGYGDDSPSLCFNGELSDWDKVQAGVMPQKDYELIRKKQQLQGALDNQARELAQYERLKEKYDNE